MNNILIWTKTLTTRCLLSKSKCWYSNNCLHFLKHAGPLEMQLGNDNNSCKVNFEYCSYEYSFEDQGKFVDCDIERIKEQSR